MTNQALPRESQRALKRYLNECRHLGLILDKFAPWAPAEHRGVIPVWDLAIQARRRRNHSPARIKGGEAKGIWLSTARSDTPQDETPSVFEFERVDVGLMRAQRGRWRTMVEACNGIVFRLTTTGRLVVGLGATHVLETSLTLDRNSGLPLIPGSALKGAARTYGLYQIAAILGISVLPLGRVRQLRESTPPELTPLETLDDWLSEVKFDRENYKRSKEQSGEGEIRFILDEKQFKKLGRELPDTEQVKEINKFCRIFGTKDAAGEICFLDAVYGGEQPPLYVADVITPHFVDYYTSGRAPADNQNPKPISFLAVEAGSEFWFGLTPRHSRGGTLLDQSATWLSKALMEQGIGGKTAAGYGFFGESE